ncbi:MAG: hypothetical protein NT027_06185 [Proteobacteria bacterium]|nr:hypothetical protein [Pseudomonadota bacterium]
MNSITCSMSTERASLLSSTLPTSTLPTSTVGRATKPIKRPSETNHSASLI